tara:strand:+ start:603 stop:770 length:168 start_codon:yes stop_codon:yes gene_type:complete
MFEIYDVSFYYLDPGSGSYLLQMLVAAGITVGIYFKSLRSYISNFFIKIKTIFKN